MNTFPHPKPVVRVFPKNLRHHVEPGPVGENSLEAPNLGRRKAPSTSGIMLNGAHTDVHYVGKVLEGEVVVSAVFGEILAKHGHRTNCGGT